MRIKCLFAVVLLLCFAAGPLPALANVSDDGPPRLVNLPPFVFPPEVAEQYAGKSVKVKLKIGLSDTGNVTEEIKIIGSSGNDVIDAVVVDAVKSAVFLPAYRNGQAIACTVVLPLQIEVKQDEPKQAADNK